MNAIGLYYLKSDNTPDLDKDKKNLLGYDPKTVDLHINIWKVERGGIQLTSEIYIDFGIMTSFNVDKLRLYLPFSIETHEDLGQRLNNQKRELCAIFNDELLPEPQSNGCYCKVKYDDKNEENFFYLYELGTNNFDVKPFSENDKESTYVTVDLKGFPDGKNDLKAFENQKRYIRFRVKVKRREEISITSHISNDMLQAAFSMSDYYDIRVNEKRGIPDKVKECMQNENFDICNFTKVHLFYIADSREKIENESSLKCDSRLLEACHWQKYKPDTDEHNTVYIAHHWKKRIIKEESQGDERHKGDCKKEESNKAISSFSVFFSTIYPELNKWRLFSYMCVVILLGWCGSMLSFKFIELKFSPLNYEGICFLIILLIVLFISVRIATTCYGIKWLKIYRKR